MHLTNLLFNPDVYAREFLFPEDVGIVAMAVEEALSFMGTHYSYQKEHRIIRRDGEVRMIVVRANVLRDPVGKILKWYGANLDITEYKRVEAALREKTEEIRRMAYTDVLTGLSNRTHINELLAGEIEKAHEGKSTGAVLFIDIDNLKTVNDTFGHKCG